MVKQLLSKTVSIAQFILVQWVKADALLRTTHA